VVTGGTPWFAVHQRAQHLDARALRFGLERSHRALARLTPDEAPRIELVDMANAIRPGRLT
jgi:serine/threonine-protein kinase PknG